MVRIASPDRQRAGTYAFARNDSGTLVCADCGAPLAAKCAPGRGSRAALRCKPCGDARTLFMRVLSGCGAAATAVARARRHGVLADPRTYSCVDCGRGAEVYDHRDYNRPLQVEPVCRSCNVMRGPAAPLNQMLVGLLLLGVARQQA